MAASDADAAAASFLATAAAPAKPPQPATAPMMAPPAAMAPPPSKIQHIVNSSDDEDTVTPAYTAPRTPASPYYGFSSGMGGATAAALAFEKPPEKEVPPRTGSIPPNPDPFAAAAPPAPSGFSNWGSPAPGGSDPFAAGAGAFSADSAFGDDASTAFR